MGKSENWIFTFNVNTKILLTDLLVRVFFLIPIFKDDIFINVSLQALTTVFTFYAAKRRASGIKAFLEMRMLSYKKIQENSSSEEINQISEQDLNISVKTINWNESLILILSTILIPTISAISFYSDRKEFLKLLHIDSFNGAELVSVLLIFVPGILLAFLYSFYREIFIGSKLIQVYQNDKKLSKDIRLDLVKFINGKNWEHIKFSIEEQNDFFILNIQTQVKIFRERLENLSLEGIFLGALSFASLMQLIGSENITGMEKMWDIPENGDFFEYFYQNFSTIKILNGEKLNHVAGLVAITFGSLLASVFYIIVLIKRFSILKLIEIAQFKIEMANSWNIKEEGLLKNDSKDNKIKMYTDLIQIELASANQICQTIKSNLALTSIVRSIGIFSFFIVILISALMIHKYIFIFSSAFATYGILASFIMGNSITLQSVLFSWKSSKSDFKILN